MTRRVAFYDVLYYFYRREPSGAAALQQSESDHVVASTAEDDIELLAFLTARRSDLVQGRLETFQAALVWFRVNGHTPTDIGF
jgi:hypothetical protein